MEETEFYTSEPSREECRRYIEKVKIDRSFMPSSRSSAGDSKFEDTEISEDDLDDSFKEYLEKALEKKNKQKKMNIKQDHEDGSSDLEFKEDPKIEPESPIDGSQCATSHTSFYFGSPRSREIKKLFALPKQSKVDVTIANMSSDIDTTFEEFLQTKRDHLLKSKDSEKEMNN